MTEKRDWEGRYQDGQPPWDTGRPDSHLVAAVEAGVLTPGTVLEVGSGTGTNALWLAGQGFPVVGVDVAPTAIKRARERVAGVDGAPSFVLADILEQDVDGAPFDAAWDRGCFHIFDEAADRARFVDRIADHLRDDGLWLSVIGSTDGPPRDTGPPRRSAAEVAAAVEPRFEVLRLESALMDTRFSTPPRIWVCLARKRS